MNFRSEVLSPALYFVGVPIGSARDITLRALDILASAPVLAAEDTRSMRRLLDIHGIPLQGRPLVALHDHTSPQVVERLLGEIRSGQAVAYASEAGMPLIADPGFELARAAAEQGLTVTCAPGPSAVLTGLALAGLPTDAFFFAGFLPNSRAARKRRLEELSAIPGTLVFFESPKRLAEMLKDAADILGLERPAAICRELTKKFEEVQRASLENLQAHYANARVKGEVVVLIDRKRSEKISEFELKEELEKAMEHATFRDAVDLVAEVQGVARRTVYQMALTLKKEG